MEEDIEAHLLVVIEEALDESEYIAARAMKWLDEFLRDEKEAQANVSARPHLCYELLPALSANF